MDKILKKNFYNLPTEKVAKELLGKMLFREINGKTYAGMIVETEAYLGEKDLACHSAKGKTKRNEVMFGAAGHAYVYMIYGMYFCLNVVTQKEGVAEAVLIRASEPVILESRDIRLEDKYLRERKMDKLLNGPGKLCREFCIGKESNGLKLEHKNGLWIEEFKDIKEKDIISCPRIGVDYAKEWKDKLLRFYIRDNVFISRKI